MSDLSQRIAALSPEKLKLLVQRLNQKKENVFSQPQIPHHSRETNSFPLSFAQQRLWFLDQLQPGNIAYNIFQGLHLTGCINVPALKQSFNELVKRHEALRTTFSVVNGQPLQVIAPNLDVTLPVIDLQKLPPERRKVEVLRLANEQVQQPFNLAKEPLLRVSLLWLAEPEYALLLTIHHIISDGWSLNVLIREITALYEAFSHGKPSPLPKLPIQYVDYAIWEQKWLQGEVLENQLNYWRHQLGSNLPSPKLPTDRPRSAVPSFCGATYNFDLSLNLYQELQKLSQQENVTLFMILLAALTMLLHRYTMQDEIVVATDVSNRNQVGTQGLIGFFVNILLLRTNLGGNPTFWELLARVREVTLGAYDHQNLPFAKLVKELLPDRHLSQTQMFEMLFVMENGFLNHTLEIPGLTLSPLKSDHESAKFDLALFIVETEQGLVRNYWHYNSHLFDRSTIARLSGHLTTLLNSIVANPDARINTLEILTETELEQQAVTKIQKKTAKINKFKAVQPQAIKLSQDTLIKTRCFPNSEKFPLIITPNCDIFDNINWAKNNHEFIETKLLHHGAILFRDFGIADSVGFENLAEAISPKLFNQYGDLPREGISGKVYGSTPYPSNKAILFHNESSHLHRCPLKIWFFCVQPAQQGGETPIVDCRKAYQILNPQLRKKLVEKQLMYVRNFTDGLDVSWQDFFRTDDKAVIENHCSQAGIDFEWDDNNGLVTRQIRPAIAVHPKTSDLVFFNQIQLHHVSYLDMEVRESLLSLFTNNKLPRNVYYGDGTPIEDSDIAEINEVYQQSKTSFHWQKGDILMLDNMLVAHGRYPYLGQRKIVVAMGEMIQSQHIAYQSSQGGSK
ncbi:condensation domain-containing protein [Nostoc sp.]|uniref:condensation domain-containing protein n=1 Tax=Nostoc sp. TaxID=1180 RepID=UPI002FF6B695